MHSSLYQNPLQFNNKTRYNTALISKYNTSLNLCMVIWHTSKRVISFSLVNYRISSVFLTLIKGNLVITLSNIILYYILYYLLLKHILIISVIVF